MREYGKVSPQLWIGDTGKKLRGCVEAQVVAAYLLSNPHANMIGLYYLPKMFICHETGLPIEGASKGLARCIEAGFCGYDEEAEVVWVPEMAKFQIAEQLKAEDKRCAGAQNEYNNTPKNKYLGDFYTRYAQAFHLSENRGKGKGHRSPFKAPPKQGEGEGAGEGASKPKARCAFELPDWVPVEAWEAFVEMRAKKAPLTPRAKELAVKALAKLRDEGHKPEDIINNSVLNGWRAFYPPKGKPVVSVDQFAGAL